MKLCKFLLLGLVFLSGCASSLYDQKPGYYSYVVGDIKTGKIKKQLYPDVFTMPASCQKVITTLLAYKDLGVDYRYETRLYQAGNDLIISFSGDPTLTSDDLLMLLKNHPIKGKIILDLSAFTTPEISKNVMLDDVGLWFSPPVSSANLDGNIFDIHVDEKGDVSSNLNYPISKDIIKGEENSLNIRWEVHQGQYSLHIYGTRCGKCDFHISPADIHSYLIKKIKLLWNKPVIVTHHVIKNKKLLDIHYSKPLKDFIPDELKKSDNLTFDALYLTLLHKYNPKPQDWNDGCEVMKNLLERHFQIKTEYLRIVDGSGASVYNKIQPRVLFEILRKGYEIDEFTRGLKPLEELKDVKMKSGAVTGVRNFCGYYKNDAFVFMASGFAIPPQKSRAERRKVSTFFNTMTSKLLKSS